MKKLLFKVAPGIALPGLPVYSRSEYSFNFEAASTEQLQELSAGEGVTSISVETLQIEINVHDGRALHVWGYHPDSSWSSHQLSPPHARAGEVFLVSNQEFISGVSIGLAEIGEWSTGFDAASGWVRVTPDLNSDDEQIILIATDTCLGLVADQLNSIWLRPTFEP